MPDLMNVKVGDAIAIASTFDPDQVYLDRPLMEVTRITAAQVIARSGSVEYRFRRKDGHLMCGNYEVGVPATPEIVEARDKHRASRDRINAVNARLHYLFFQPRTATRNMTVEQLEALADAWEKVKAMGVSNA